MLRVVHCLLSVACFLLLLLLLFVNCSLCVGVRCLLFDAWCLVFVFCWSMLFCCLLSVVDLVVVVFAVVVVVVVVVCC